MIFISADGHYAINDSDACVRESNMPMIGVLMDVLTIRTDRGDVVCNFRSSYFREVGLVIQLDDGYI